jgi:hypothetical protein
MKTDQHRYWLAALAIMVAIFCCGCQTDALAISANIQGRHMPFGTILDPIFASPASNDIIGYTRCGDSALWTGHYLAANPTATGSPAIRSL